MMIRKIFFLLLFVVLLTQQSCTEEEQGVEFAIKDYIDFVKMKGTFIEPNVKYQYVGFGESKKIDLKFCKDNFGIPEWIPDDYVSSRYKNDTVWFGDDTMRSTDKKIVLDTTRELEIKEYYGENPSTQLIYDGKGRVIKYVRNTDSSDDKSPKFLRVEYDDNMNRVNAIIVETFLYGDESYYITYDDKGDIERIVFKTKQQTIKELERVH